DDGDGFVESAELRPDPLGAVVLVLGRAGKLTGVVVDERGAPVAHATVKAWGGSTAAERVVTANDDGRYLIERMAPAMDRVTAWAPGFDPATRTVVRHSGSETLNVLLAPSRPVHGMVVGPTGRPVAGARIRACERSAAEGAISDGAGGF